MNNNFISNVSNIMSWSVLSQVMAGLSFFLISQIYDSSAIGVYGFYLAAISVVASCSTFRIEMSLPISKSDEDFVDRYNFVNKVNLYFSFLVLIILSMFYSFYDNLNPFAFFFGVYFFGIYRILNMKALYLSDFTSVGKAKFVQVFSMLFLQITIGFYLANSNAMIFGFVFGQICSILFYLIYFKRSKALNTIKPKLESTRRSFINNINYLKYDTPAIFINTLSNELPSLLFPLAYGASQSGYYVMAYRILIVPVTFIGSTLGQVLLAHSPNWMDDKVLFPKLSRIMLPLIIICLLGIAFSVFFIEDFFAFLLGDEWDLTAEIMSVLCISSLFQFIYSPFSVLVQLLNIQSFNFKFHMVMLSCKCFVIIFFSFFLKFEILSTLKVLVIISVCAYSFYLIFLLKMTKHLDSR